MDTPKFSGGHLQSFAIQIRTYILCIDIFCQTSSAIPVPVASELKTKYAADFKEVSIIVDTFVISQQMLTVYTAGLENNLSVDEQQYQTR